MRYDPTVTVCSLCLRACCWQGEFMCDGSYGANIVKRKVSTLIGNGMKTGGEPHEHPDWWNVDLMVGNQRLLTPDDLRALGIVEDNYLELAETT